MLYVANQKSSGDTPKLELRKEVRHRIAVEFTVKKQTYHEASMVVDVAAPTKEKAMEAVSKYYGEHGVDDDYQVGCIDDDDDFIIVTYNGSLDDCPVDSDWDDSDFDFNEDRCRKVIYTTVTTPLTRDEIDNANKQADNMREQLMKPKEKVSAEVVADEMNN